MSDWRARADCRYVDPELFFRDDADSRETAKAVCAGCPVRDACLDWAVERRVEHGVWAGTSWHERKVLRLEQRRPAA